MIFLLIFSLLLKVILVIIIIILFFFFIFSIIHTYVLDLLSFCIFISFILIISLHPIKELCKRKYLVYLQNIAV